MKCLMMIDDATLVGALGVGLMQSGILPYAFAAGTLTEDEITQMAPDILIVTDHDDMRQIAPLIGWAERANRRLCTILLSNRPDLDRAGFFLSHVSLQAISARNAPADQILRLVLAGLVEATTQIGPSYISTVANGARPADLADQRRA